MKQHNSGDKFPTARQVCRESDKLRALYNRWTQGKAGRKPTPTVFIIEAFRRLCAEKNISRIGQDDRRYLENHLPGLSTGDLQENKIYRSCAHREIRWAANWEDLRRGQKVFELIKRKRRGETGRKIQLKLSISKDTLGNLPSPTPYLRKVRTGKSSKYVFDLLQSY